PNARISRSSAPGRASATATLVSARPTRAKNLACDFMRLPPSRAARASSALRHAGRSGPQSPARARPCSPARHVAMPSARAPRARRSRTRASPGKRSRTVSAPAGSRSRSSSAKDRAHGRERRRRGRAAARRASSEAFGARDPHRQIDRETEPRVGDLDRRAADVHLEALERTDAGRQREAERERLGEAPRELIAHLAEALVDEADDALVDRRGQVPERELLERRAHDEVLDRDAVLELRDDRGLDEERDLLEDDRRERDAADRPGEPGARRDPDAAPADERHLVRALDAEVALRRIVVAERQLEGR